MEKSLHTLKPLDRENILSASDDDITQRLVRLERKVDLLIDTLGGYREYYNGGYVHNNLNDMLNGLAAIYELLRDGFPYAAKRAKEIKRLRDEGIRPLSR